MHRISYIVLARRYILIIAMGVFVTMNVARADVAPIPIVSGNQLNWPAVAASTINVHMGDGTYLTTLPGNATSWISSAPSDYYLVATSAGDWRNWLRSETVTIVDPSDVTPPMPVVTGNQLDWPAVAASAINVHMSDGTYLTTLPGDATSWISPAPGDYYLVATTDGDWRNWLRSETVTIVDPSDVTPPMPVVTGNQLDWPSVAASAINVHMSDGTYLTTLPGDATSWISPAPGDYYLVATTDGDWRNWMRSETITVIGSNHLSCGDVIASTISASGETDLYTFIGQQEDRREIVLRETGGNFVGNRASARAVLISPTGVELGDLFLLERLEITLPETGTYTLRVASSDLGTTGNYSLGLTCLQPPFPVDAVLSCGDVIASTISVSGETDLYTFIGRQEDRREIVLRETGGNFVGNRASAHAVLISPTGVELGDLFLLERLEITLPETGTYTLRVASSDLGTTGNYSLGLTCLQPPFPVDAVLSCGDVIASTISVSGETDLYTFIGRQEDRREIVLRETGGNFVGNRASAHAVLISPTGVELGDLFLLERLEITLPETGTYTLRVASSDLGTTGNYSLGLTCLQPPFPVDAVLSCGDVIASTISVSGETDLYTFIGRQEDRREIVLRETGGNFVGNRASAHAVLISPTGVELGDLFLLERLEITLPETGTYILRIASSDLGTTGSYDIGLQCP